MGEAKHTPGPWIADDNEGFSPWTIWSRMTPTGHGTPGPQVATVVGDSSEADANARLIAAAPDLLALLMRLQRLGGLGLDVHAQIDAAIAKATGTAP